MLCSCRTAEAMATILPPLSRVGGIWVPRYSAERLASRVKDSTSAYRLAVSPAAIQSLRSISWLISSGTRRMVPVLSRATSSPTICKTCRVLATQSVPSTNVSIPSHPSFYQMVVS